MADIFISYSRKDSDQALSLAELLRAEGMDVWIDQHGLEAASSWSKEIVGAIKDCKAFCLLLSQSSLISNSVIKETSLASEFKCSIIPIELHKVELTDDFHYQLAGLQRVAISDFAAILRAVKKLGVGATTNSGTDSESASGVSPERTKVRSTDQLTDTRKSLIVLPFEDLSPKGEDNAWFADGLAGEMIDVLGHIKSLRILDRKTSIGLRKTSVTTVEIGRLFNTRYFIEGSVRKFGEQIKISVALLDIQTGDYLWQESHRGEFKDIFDIQESVAAKVVEGLKLHLTHEEKTLLQSRGTENAEAYELFVKADEYFHRHSKEGFLLSVQLYTEAIKLDSDYAVAYASKAHTLANLYRNYDRDPALLEEALQLANEALRLKPDLWKAYNPLSLILLLKGEVEASEQAVKEYIRNEPEDPNSHFTLGFFYCQIGQFAKAISPFEQTIKLDPDYLTAYINIVISCNKAQDETKQLEWAAKAIPKSERHLKLFPDDEDGRVNHAILLHFGGRDDEARETARQHENIKDGKALFNIACLQCDLHDYESSMKTFCKAIEAGYQDVRLLNEFLNPPPDYLARLKNTADYQKAIQMVGKIETELPARAEGR